MMIGVQFYNQKMLFKASRKDLITIILYSAWAVKGFKSASVRVAIILADYKSAQQTQNVDPKWDQCWFIVRDIGPTLKQHWINVSSLLASQQTRVIHPMLFQCWSTVFDAGPTLKHHWANAPCSLGYTGFMK